MYVHDSKNMYRKIHVFLMLVLSTIFVDTSNDDVIFQRYGNIKKLPSDQREYRGFQLKNQMKVLLISDVTAERSAATLHLNVGSLSDPEYLPGLAHLYEHIALLRTKNQSEDNSLNQFVTKRGGGCNAVTNLAYTKYHFIIAPEYLSQSLKLFARFFTSPYIDKDSIEPELLAVDSEFESYHYNDHRRLYHLRKITLNNSHPYARFQIGNRESLYEIPKKMGVDIQDELWKFSQKWYSSNVMTLVILGKESLDDLEQMSIEYFSDIQNRNATEPEYPSPYTEEYVGYKLYAVPVQDIKKLKVSFSIPNDDKYYRSKPINFIGNLVSNSRPGSLLWLLKSNGWCTSLYTGLEKIPGFSLFDITVALTESGIEHTDEIIQLYFQYFNLLKGGNFKKRIFNEMSTILKNQFKFQEEDSAQTYTNDLAGLLQEYPMEEVLTSPNLMTDWNPVLVEEFLSMMTPDRIRVTIVGKIFESICDQTDKWYGVKYHLEKIPKELINRWSDSGRNIHLYLPPPNMYISSNFKLYSPEPGSERDPIIILDTPSLRVWYKQDVEQALPKMNSFFNFDSHISNMDPLNSSLKKLLAMVFDDEISEEAAAARMAGINYQTYSTNNGLTMAISGFNSKQMYFFQYLINKMATLKINPERFNILKDQLIKSLESIEAWNPLQQATYYLRSTITDRFWSNQEMLVHSKAITIESLQNFREQFLSKLYVECFIHGNTIKNKALEMVLPIQNMLPKTHIPLVSQESMMMRCIQLENGSNYRLEIYNQIQRASCISIYYQCGLESTESKILLEFISHMISEPAFSILRSKEQLGYTVITNILRRSGVHGLEIIVQSDRHPSYLETRIEAFLQHIEEVLEDISEDQFDIHRQALIQNKLERQKSLTDRAYILIPEIDTQQYQFDRPRIEAEFLKNVTLEQVLNLFKDKISVKSQNRQRLSVHIISSAEGVEHPYDLNKNPDLRYSLPDNLFPVPEIFEKVVLIEDMLKFKSGRALYPSQTPKIQWKMSYEEK